MAAGALVQATADFFLRERTAAGMLALAAAGLVHVLSQRRALLPRWQAGST